ncbi:MAG TPA: hypothetical protein VGW38_10865, partial [Chloroflexota bacterium]|nr:hypothetical protein [Chloroflexota bacterium]
MKILFVTPQLPWPPTQGTTLRNYHLIRSAATAHQVDMLSFGPSASVPAPLATLCRQVFTVPFPVRTTMDRVRDLAMGRADMERRLWSPDFETLLLRLLHEGAYDVVQLEGFEVAGY